VGYSITELLGFDGLSGITGVDRDAGVGGGNAVHRRSRRCGLYRLGLCLLDIGIVRHGLGLCLLDIGILGILGVIRVLGVLGVLGCVERAGIGRILHHRGGLLHLLHRLVERRLQLGLEPGAHLLQLGIGLGEATGGIWQLLRAQHDKGDEQDEDDLTALEIEHDPKSTVLP